MKFATIIFAFLYPFLVGSGSHPDVRVYHTHLRLVRYSGNVNPAPTTNQYAPGEYLSVNGDSTGNGVYVQGNDVSTYGSGGVGIQGIPHKIPGAKPYSQVFTDLHAGGYVSQDSGGVFMVGGNMWGDYGNGNTTGNTGVNEIVRDSAGNLFDSVVMVVGGFHPVTNSSYYLALKVNGTVWGWGDLRDGARGNGLAGAALSKPVQISMGSAVIRSLYANAGCFAITTTNTVLAWGDGDNYQADLGYAWTGTQNQTPHDIGLTNVKCLAAGNGFNYALDFTGTVLKGWGEYGGYMCNLGTSPPWVNVMTTPTLLNSFLGIPTIDTIATSEYFTYILTPDSSLHAWGGEEFGFGRGNQLNWAAYTQSPSPTGGTPSPYNPDYGPGELLISSPVTIAPGAKFTRIFGGVLYTFNMKAEEWINGYYRISGAGRGKAAPRTVGLDSALIMTLKPRARIASDTLNAQIEASFSASWNDAYLTPENNFTTIGNQQTPGDYCALNPGVFPCTNVTNRTGAGPTISLTNLSGAPGTYTLDARNCKAHYWNYYRWTLVSKPGGATVNMGVQAYPLINVNLSTVGTYTFQFYLKDDISQADSGTMTVTVSSGAQTGWYWDTAGSGTACTFAAPCAPSYFNTAYASETAGDTNYFKRGETFKIQIIANASGSAGNPIVSKPYGTGNLPVLGGRMTLTWANVSGNIWQTAHTGVRENILQHNDTIYTQTTLPDLAAGWNIATSITTTQITDAAHVGQVIVGSKICVRSSAYTIDTAIVTNITGSVITFSPAAAYSGGVGWKVMNLTPYEYGQCQDTLGQIRIYSIGAPTGTWTIPNVDTVLLSEGAYQEWDSLRFQGGNNADIILAFQGTGNNTFKADSVTDGFDGFELRTEGNLTVKNTVMRHFNNNAVWKTNTNNYNNSFLNDTIYDVGMQPGMGKSGNVQGYSGIIAGDSGSVVKFCSIYSIGYLGVANYGSGFKVDSNSIKKVCWILEDGGFIYTWIAFLGIFAIPREMIGNVCDSSGGPTASLGVTLTSLAGYGLYLDQATSNVLVSGNSLSHTTGGAIFDHGPSNTITGNTSYASQYCDMEAYESGPVITGLIIKHNNWVSPNSTTPGVRFITVNNDLSTFGVSDSNTVIGHVPIYTPYWTFSTGASDPGTFRTTTAWTSLLGYDTHSSFIYGYPSYLANGSGVNATYQLAGVYVDLSGGVHWGTITIPPYQSKILFPYSIPIAVPFAGIPKIL